MTRRLLLSLMTLVLLHSGCIPAMAADKDKVIIHYDGNAVKVTNKVKKVQVKSVGAKVMVNNALTDREVEFVLDGHSDNGNFEYVGNYKTTIVLNGLHLKSDNGCAINLKCGKRIKLQIADNTTNSLEDADDTLHKACVYTKGHLEVSGAGSLTLVGHSKSVIAAKEYIEFKPSTGHIVINSGYGNGINTESNLSVAGGNISINLAGVDKKGLKSDSVMILKDCAVNIIMTGDGGKGIKCGDDLVMDNASINVTTTGNYISEANGWGGPMGGFGGPGGFGGFNGEMNDSTFHKMMEEGRKRFEEMMANGEMPFGFGGPPEGFGPPPEGFGGPMGGFGAFGHGGNNIELSDSVRKLLFADIDNAEHGSGFGGKRKYNGTAKAIKAMGSITINGGDIRLETSTAGAEGLEGKKGITINDGHVWVKAQDDAFSSNGKIVFNGGDVLVWSMGNDAIDSNSRESGAITINGGTVIACSQPGPPEEAFDCDFSPFILTGGTVFGMGGSMGGEATTPTVDDHTQPTVVLTGLPCPKDKTLIVTDENGKEMFSFVFPFTMQQSSSILSLPAFRKGHSYVVKIKDPDVTIKNFTFDDVIAR